MATENDDGSGAMSGSELQNSQSGGQSGEAGSNRDQQQSGQAGHGGQQMGGGATAPDFDKAGGSGGTGGYGNAQNQENHQGQAAYGNSTDPQQSRSERFDELQGGGRGPDSLSSDDSGAAQADRDPAGDAILGSAQGGAARTAPGEDEQG